MSQTPVISEIAAAGLIVYVRVESRQFGSWQPGADGLLERTGTLDLRLLEVLQGRLTDPVGEVVQIAVAERGGEDTVLDYYGLWSQVSTEAGSELAGLCDGSTQDLASQLTEEHCSSLQPAASVLPDLRLALELRARHLTADQILAEAGRLRAEGGARFARFVWVQVREAVVSAPDRFDVLMRIAEDPATRTDAQDAYLRAAYEDDSVTESLDTGQRARLARAMFRTALDPAQRELREHLLTTFLPNLVEAPQPLSSTEVFDERPELAEQVRTDEADESTSAYGERLSRWLSTEEGV
ncbi:hypothetical protein [Kribbella catacumbae]|uniref:hypothetical protein n=1 Tax=Kribbella catacumbae TaxID=460086 RepID=UPI000366E452|nr:hypothetical protein [Kribbella catacumbae]